MRMKNDEDFVIVIDTREQKPYSFPCNMVKAGLETGDYSLLGHETRIAVERKRPEEMFLCVGKERKRFERELERFVGFEYAAIVIEGNLGDMIRPSAFSTVSPKTVINSLVSWSVRFNVHVYFCGTRNLARTLTYRLLQKFWKHRRGTDAE